MELKKDMRELYECRRQIWRLLCEYIIETLKKDSYCVMEEVMQFCENAVQDVNQLYKKIKQYPLISLFFIIAVLLLVALPKLQVSEINNATEKATLENQDRVTLAQIIGGLIGGIALLYGIYMTVENIKISNETKK